MPGTGNVGVPGIPLTQEADSPQDMHGNYRVSLVNQGHCVEEKLGSVGSQDSVSPALGLSSHY